MKIGLVVPEFPPDTIGGGGIVFEALALQLHLRGHDLRVLTSETVGGPRGNDAAYPFPILRVRQFKHLGSQYRTYMPPLPHRLLAARPFLRDRDVYHLHGYGMAFIDAAFALIADPRRTVFTSHGLPYTARRSRGLLGALYAGYDRLVGSRVVRGSRALTAVSTAAAEEIRSVYGRPAMVVPNGFEPLASAPGCSPALESEMAKGRYLLCVGRIEPLKGFEIVVRALRRLVDGGTDLRLIVAGGDNAGRVALERAIAESELGARVSLVGPVARPDLARLYERAAVCVVASFAESFSLVTLEGMSAGVPCALSAVGGMLDIGREGENALFFAPGDAGGIAGAVARIEGEPGLRERLIAGGRATVARYAWPRVVETYENIYARVCELGGGNRPPLTSTSN